MSKVFDITDIINNKKSIKDNCCNIVYFLLKNNEVVYVGKTIFGPARILNHIEAKEKDFDSFSMFSVDKEKLLEIELANINFYRPKYNKYAGGEYSYSKKLKMFIKREEKHPKREYILTYKGRKIKNLTSLAKELGMSISGVSRGVRKKSFCNKYKVTYKEC